MSYGIVEDKTSLRFPAGLTDNCKLTKFEFNPNGGKAGSAKQAFDIELQAPNGAVINSRIFPVDQKTPFLNKKKDGSTETPDEAIKRQQEQIGARMSHIARTFVTDKELREKIANVASFEEYAKKMQSLLKGKFENVPIRVKALYDGKGYIKLPTYGRVIELMSNEISVLEISDRERANLIPPAAPQKAVSFEGDISAEDLANL